MDDGEVWDNETDEPSRDNYLDWGDVRSWFDTSLYAGEDSEMTRPTLFQRRSQNAEKVTHIKGRPLDQAMILFNCVPFQMGTPLKGKNSLPEGANSSL